MKKIHLIKKILLFVLFVTFLASCSVTLNDSNEEDTTKNPETEVESNTGKKIYDEYQSLTNNTSTTKTHWEFEGVVVDMSATRFDEQFQNYQVTLILNVDDYLIGINNGLVNRTNPVNINGLTVGTKITVSGFINLKIDVTSGSSYAEIAFDKPEIVWDGMNMNPDVPSENEPTNTPTVPPTVSKINFAMINDTHGAFNDSNDGYSIGRVDTLIDNLENSNGEYIKIANGDILQGSYLSSKTYGYALIEALNEMDFDAFVIGNHEFDWGIDKVAAYKDGDLSNGEANFPFLGANIVYKETGKRPDWIEPYTIVEYSDVKVGIIGLLGGDQESDILASHVSAYEFLDSPVTLIKNYVKELRVDKDCDVVVVSTHDWADNFTSSNYVNSLAALTGDYRIDALFTAHFHYLINTSINRGDGYQIPVVQNKGKNLTIQSLTLNINEHRIVDSYTGRSYNPGSYAISSDLNDIFNKYLNLTNESNEIIGYTSSEITKEELGALAVKSMTNYTYDNASFNDVALSIINTSGVRASIDKGDITVADVFNTFPFENKVILVKMKGTYIKQLTNNSYFYKHSLYTSFENSQVYVIAVIDYVYYSTYNKNLFANVIEEYDPNVLMRDTLIEQIKSDY